MSDTHNDKANDGYASRGRSFLRRIARDLAFLAALALVPLTLARFIAADWPWELLSNFQFQYWVASIVAIALAILARSKWLTVAALVPLIVTTFAIAPYWVGGGGGGGGGGPASAGSAQSVNAATITIFHANVLTENREHHLVLHAIDEHDPDIIVLQEADRYWLAAMAPLREKYPHALEMPRGDNFGMIVFSRLPLQDATAEFFGDLELPWCRFTVALDSERIDFIATHPLPPMQSWAAERRNAQLAAVADIVAVKTNPTVIIGDLNITPWSLHFTRLTAKANLRDARRGFGLNPTWPADFPAPCRIPIDHCLVSDDVVIHSFEVGGDIGSDHLPVIVELGR